MGTPFDRSILSPEPQSLSIRPPVVSPSLRTFFRGVEGESTDGERVGGVWPAVSVLHGATTIQRPALPGIPGEPSRSRNHGSRPRHAQIILPPLLEIVHPAARLNVPYLFHVNIPQRLRLGSTYSHSPVGARYVDESRCAFVLPPAHHRRRNL